MRSFQFASKDRKRQYNSPKLPQIAPNYLPWRIQGKSIQAEFSRTGSLMVIAQEVSENL